MTEGLKFFTGYLIRRAQQAHVALWQQEVSTAISGPQFGVLSVLHEMPGSSQAFVCQELDLDRSTIADLVGRLERRGFIVRNRHREDKRRNVLFLTDEGQAEFERLFPRVERMDRILTRDLTGDETIHLRRLLMAVLGQRAPLGEVTSSSSPFDDSQLAASATKADPPAL